MSFEQNDVTSTFSLLCLLCGEETEGGSREAREEICRLLFYFSFLSLQSKETVLKTMLQGHLKDCQAMGAWDGPQDSSWTGLGPL